MLTTQRKIAEQILRRLKKFTDESDIDERELMIATHQSLASIVRNRYFQGKQDETGEVDGSLYYTIHNNEVLEDDNIGYHIKTPSSAIALPFGIDISRVWSMKGRGFIEVPKNFNDMYYNMETSMLAGLIGFYRSGNDLVFVNMTNINKPEKISITMLLPFGSLDEDDEMTIPADMVDEVIETVFVKYAKSLQIPTDETNDSNDN